MKYSGNIQLKHHHRKKQEATDAALIIDGKPLIFLEQKGFNEGLDKHVNQLLRYIRADEIPWGILTNATEIRLFNRPGEIFKICLDSYYKEYKKMRLLSKEAVVRDDLEVAERRMEK